MWYTESIKYVEIYIHGYLSRERFISKLANQLKWTCTENTWIGDNFPWCQYIYMRCAKIAGLYNIILNFIQCWFYGPFYSLAILAHEGHYDIQLLDIALSKSIQPLIFYTPVHCSVRRNAYMYFWLLFLNSTLLSLFKLWPSVHLEIQSIHSRDIALTRKLYQ